ncbi:MAG: Outer rane efflux protein, partial [Pedosphaera sp.]|nr:Outer rane efflux protein [Pedosphaera sp.]
MGSIDEITKIKHPARLMQLTRMFCITFAGLALTAGAQDQQPPTSQLPPPQDLSEARQTRVLTVEEAVRLALEHNLDIQIQRYNPIVNQFLLESGYGIYEPAFNFRAVRNFNSSPGGINPQTGLPFTANERTQDTYVPDIAGTLPWTGLTYDLSGPLSRTVGNSVGLGSKFASDPGITLTQPLLKNFLIDKYRYQILLSKNTLKTSEEAVRLQIMTVVENVKAAYYNLIYAREQVKVNVKALELNEQLLTENRKRVQVGALAPLDEKQAESQAAISRADLLLAEQNLASQENIVKNLLTDNFSEWAFVTPIPSESLVAVPVQLSLQESWRAGLAQRPEIIEQKLNLERQNITVRYNHNQLFPEVDLVGSYGRNALAPTLDQNFGGIRDGNNPFYSYGVSITIPLGNIAARNSYSAAKAQVKQVLLQLKKQEQTIVVQIDNDIKVVRSSLQRVDATRAARIYAETALEAEQKKLENGKSTSFVVL